jgi:hypothetical protein
MATIDLTGIRAIALSVDFAAPKAYMLEARLLSSSSDDIINSNNNYQVNNTMLHDLSMSFELTRATPPSPTIGPTIDSHLSKTGTCKDNICVAIDGATGNHPISSLGIHLHRGVIHHLSVMPLSDDDIEQESSISPSSSPSSLAVPATGSSTTTLSLPQYSLLEVSLFDKSDALNLVASHSVPFRRVCMKVAGETPSDGSASRVRSVSSSSSSQSSSLLASPQSLSKSTFIPKRASIRINEPIHFSLSLKPRAAHKVARLIIHSAAHLPPTKPSRPIPPSAYCTVYLIDSFGNKRSMNTLDARTEG